MSGTATRVEVSEAIGLGESRTRGLLRELVDEGALVAEGSARRRVYKAGSE